MSHGYTLRVYERNRQADQRKLGVRLGALCIGMGVPVTVVSKRLGVSRATIYNWFCGTSVPQDSLRRRIEVYIAELQSA